MNSRCVIIIMFLILAICSLNNIDQAIAEDQRSTKSNAENKANAEDKANVKSNLKAFLLFPVKIQEKTYGKAGQIINYSENKEKNGYIIEVEDKIFGGIGSYGIIPCDPDFAMSWLYLLVSKNEIFEIMQMKDLIKSILSTFPTHPLYEEIFASIVLERGGYKYGRLDLLEVIASPEELKIAKDEKSEDKYISAICEIYLNKYPQGKYRDIFHWLAFYFTNKPYEIEGSPKVAIEQAGLYENYLSEHKESKASDEIKLRIAESYIIAYECLKYGESEGYQENKGDEFLKKSIALYKELSENNDLKIRESAKIALYNISHGKRIYFNPNGWHRWQ
ncbi:TPA: hypothetical protein ENX78_02505 [Candidatus Poribacteria bacterium]|nr:hypothetical protein [Candidatus Poribacteria bacterium]